MTEPTTISEALEQYEADLKARRHWNTAADVLITRVRALSDAFDRRSAGAAADNGRLRAALAGAQEDLVHAHARVDALRAALLKYGVHDPACARIPNPCTCGFQQALAHGHVRDVHGHSAREDGLERIEEDRLEQTMRNIAREVRSDIIKCEADAIRRELRNFRDDELAAANERIEALTMRIADNLGEYDESLADVNEQLAAAQAERDESVRKREWMEEWYATRHQQLRDTLRSSNLWHAYHEIMANGSEGGQPPTYAQQFNIMRHRAERAEERIAELEARAPAPDVARALPEGWVRKEWKNRVSYDHGDKLVTVYHDGTVRCSTDVRAETLHAILAYHLSLTAPASPPSAPSCSDCGAPGGEHEQRGWCSDDPPPEQQREPQVPATEPTAALALLARCVKYAREDEMTTRHSTRLARALAEAERLLAQQREPQVPATAPESDGEVK